MRVTGAACRRGVGGEQLEWIGKKHRRDGKARRLGAMAAPVAAHAGAVIDDPGLLAMPKL